MTDLPQILPLKGTDIEARVETRQEHADASPVEIDIQGNGDDVRIIAGDFATPWQRGEFLRYLILDWNEVNK